MYKVRFNLGRGENYRKWQVREKEGNKLVGHYNPEKCHIKMIGCTLKNNKTTAEKIFKGARKSVCAWIECENLTVGYYEPYKYTEQIKYNPKEAPYWTDRGGKDIDGQRLNELITIGKKVFKVL